MFARLVSTPAGTQSGSPATTCLLASPQVRTRAPRTQPVARGFEKVAFDAIDFLPARFLRVRVTAAVTEPPRGVRSAVMARQAASSVHVSRSLVPMLVESLRNSDGQPVLPRRREPDLAGLAAFTLDPGGQVVSWSGSAAALFGKQAHAAIGRHVCDVLMTGPGQRELVGHALAEVAAGRVWGATVAGGSLGEGRFAFRWEPMAGPGGAVLAVAQRAWPEHTPSWLSEATARIGSSLDLAETAAEVA